MYYTSFGSQQSKPFFLLLISFVLLLLLQGCASKEHSDSALQNQDLTYDFEAEYAEDVAPSVEDPFEGFNRTIHSFNDFLLLDVIKPVHKGYSYIVPTRIRSGLSNFANHLAFPVRFLNALMQFDLGGAGVELGYFIINSVTSLGLADISHTKEAYHYHNKQAYSFDVTLARWGFAEGSPIMLPIFGPKGIRGVFGLAGDIAMDPLAYVLPIEASLVQGGINFNTLDQIYMPYEQLKQASIDPYIAIRDAVILNQRNLTRDHLQKLEEIYF